MDENPTTQTRAAAGKAMPGTAKEPGLPEKVSQLRNSLRQSWLPHRFRHRLSCGCPSLRNGIFIQAVFSSSYRIMLSVRPLCSTGVTPLLRSYGPFRLPAGPPPRLCIPAARWLLPLPPDRASQAPRLIFPRALSPTTPEGPMAACACCFTTGLSGFIQVGRTGHLHIPIEAESGSLALRLACSPHKFANPIAGTRARLATC